MAERVSRHGQGLGWDGPVEVVLPGTVDWQQDAKTFAALIQDSAPVGRGTLKRDLSLRRGGYKRIPKPGQGFEAVIHNAYAYIQDQGGDVPERRPTGVAGVSRPAGKTLDVADDMETVTGERVIKWLKWHGPAGPVFAKKAGPFHLPGSGYIETGFDRWVHARGHGGGLSVRWKELGEAA